MEDGNFEQPPATASTEHVIEKLNHITIALQYELKLIDEHGHLSPEAEPHIMPLLFKFLQRRKGAGMNLTLIIALYHNSSLRIPMHKLTEWTALAWEAGTQRYRTSTGQNYKNKQTTLLGEGLDRTAAPTDTQDQVVTKLETVISKLRNFSPAFRGHRELTATEWGWMHTRVG